MLFSLSLFFKLWNSESEFNTCKVKVYKLENPAWTKLDETSFIESTIHHLTQMEQEIPATISSTDFAKVFEHGSESQVTSFSGLPLGKYFQVALKSVPDSML